MIDIAMAMTAAATRFVGPLTFRAWPGNWPVLDDVFELDADQQIAHIELAEAADAIVLAPATANLLGELAAGLVGRCGDRDRFGQSSAGGSLRRPWTPACGLHPATQRNVAQLREVRLPPSSSRRSASWHRASRGSGALPSRSSILEAVERLFARAGDLEGLHVVVSAGGTREPLDPVRFIGNRSSGKMGAALRRSGARSGGERDPRRRRHERHPATRRGPSLMPPPRRRCARQCFSAATSCRHPGHGRRGCRLCPGTRQPAQDQALRREPPRSSSVPNPDIVAEVGEMPDDVRPFLIGFAAEVERSRGERPPPSFATRGSI